MSRLAEWWHRVFGEAPPLDHSSVSHESQAVSLPPERQAVIDALTRRQHDQANEITAETGRAYVTRKRAETDGEAARLRQRRTDAQAEAWRRHEPG